MWISRNSVFIALEAEEEPDREIGLIILTIPEGATPRWEAQAHGRTLILKTQTAGVESDY